MREIKFRERKRILRDSKGAYIHKYYVPQELKKLVTQQDIDAIYYTETSLWAIKPEEVEQFLATVEDYTIHYEIAGTKKTISKDIVIEVLKACLAYIDDCYSPLKPKEVSAALEMNRKLIELEKIIQKECIRLNKELKKRLTENDGFLADYEIDIHISFCINEDNPLFDEDDCGESEIMYEVEEIGKFITEEKVSCEDYTGIGSDHNWTEVPDPDHPIRKERHCWLFHCLYGHSPLPHKDITLIDYIATDIKVHYQNWFEINKAG